MNKGGEKMTKSIGTKCPKCGYTPMHFENESRIVDIYCVRCGTQLKKHRTTPKEEVRKNEVNV